LATRALVARVAHNICKGSAPMANDTDMKAHVSTYNSIMWLLKWGAVACFILAFIVIWLIS
jgi:hypothetical protein